MMSDLYQDRVLDHYRNPRNLGVLEGADVDAREENPLCGDEVRVTARLEGGRIAEARFDGRGCAISLASASLLTERVRGMTPGEARALGRADVVALLGVPVSPVRQKCALLAWSALRKGLEGR